MDTYSAQDVTVNVNGYDVTGFGENDVVKIVRAEDSFGMVIDAQGKASRYKTNNKSGSIIITNQQDSEANAIFLGYLNLDEETGLGTATVTVTTPDFKAIANEAFIKKPPEFNYGRELNTREWEFVSGEVKLAIVPLV